jgi:hypothetical protein
LYRRYGEPNLVSWIEFILAKFSLDAYDNVVRVNQRSRSKVKSNLLEQSISNVSSLIGQSCYLAPRSFPAKYIPELLPRLERSDLASLEQLQRPKKD